MSTIQLPSPEDRQHVHNLINHYARGKCSRNDMMRWVAHIIGKYPRITRLPVFGYSVRVLTYYGDLPIISIESAILSDSCPSCGAATSEARYLRTEKEQFGQDHDIVSVTCLECGCVYTTKGANGRKVSVNYE